MRGEEGRKEEGLCFIKFVHCGATDLDTMIEKYVKFDTYIGKSITLPISYNFETYVYKFFTNNNFYHTFSNKLAPDKFRTRFRTYFAN